MPTKEETDSLIYSLLATTGSVIADEIARLGLDPTGIVVALYEGKNHESYIAGGIPKVDGMPPDRRMTAELACKLKKAVDVWCESAVEIARRREEQEQGKADKSRGKA